MLYTYPNHFVIYFTKLHNKKIYTMLPQLARHHFLLLEKHTRQLDLDVEIIYPSPSLNHFSSFSIFQFIDYATSCHSNFPSLGYNFHWIYAVIVLLLLFLPPRTPKFDRGVWRDPLSLKGSGDIKKTWREKKTIRNEFSREVPMAYKLKYWTTAS